MKSCFVLVPKARRSFTSRQFGTETRFRLEGYTIHSSKSHGRLYIHIYHQCNVIFINVLCVTSESSTVLHFPYIHCIVLYGKLQYSLIEQSSNQLLCMTWLFCFNSYLYTRQMLEHCGASLLFYQSP